MQRPADEIALHQEVLNSVSSEDIASLGGCGGGVGGTLAGRLDGDLHGFLDNGALRFRRCASSWLCSPSRSRFPPRPRTSPDVRGRAARQPQGRQRRSPQPQGRRDERRLARRDAELPRLQDAARLDRDRSRLTGWKTTRIRRQRSGGVDNCSRAAPTSASTSHRRRTGWAARAAAGGPAATR